MSNEFTKSSTAVLMIGHIAGMVDMVALPLWVGTLMQTYKFTPQTAGMAVTLFLLMVAFTSMVLAPLFNRLPRKLFGFVGFAIAAATFYKVSELPSSGESLEQSMMVLHAIAGIGIGGGLSMTHGAMGRTDNPHRMFAWANGLLGVFAVGFLGSMPNLIEALGGQVIFVGFAIVMGFAALALLIAFPALDGHDSSQAKESKPIPKAAWFAIITVVFLTLNYAMVFSFIERMGAARQFPAQMIGGVLLALGLVNLLPGPLAGIFERKVSAIAVAMLAPVLQAALALVLFNAQDFSFYSIAGALCVMPVMFGHIFLFGLMSRLDTSGRAAASTPAMVMLGSSIGPVLGGVLVQQSGYSAIGIASVVIGILAAGSAYMIKVTKA
jgi:predicted MFS family arabinose efflux permease